MHMEVCGFLPGIIPAFVVHSTQMVWARYFSPHSVIAEKLGYSLSGHLSLHTLPSPLPPANNAYFRTETDFFITFQASAFYQTASAYNSLKAATQREIIFPVKVLNTSGQNKMGFRQKEK